MMQLELAVGSSIKLEVSFTHLSLCLKRDKLCHPYTYIHIHTYHTYIHIYTYIHIHTFIHTYHTYIHTHTHILQQSLPCFYQESPELIFIMFYLLLSHRSEGLSPSLSCVYFIYILTEKPRKKNIIYQ